MQRIAWLGWGVCLATACYNSGDSPALPPVCASTASPDNFYLYHAGQHTFTFTTTDGRARTFMVYVPPDYDRQPTPVVMILHGGGGDFENMPQISAIEPTADRHGFLAVYPAALPFGQTGGVWNDGNDALRAPDVDDVQFVRELLDDLARRFHTDPCRVYAAGISNGGAMAYRLACELSDRITAVAPIAAGPAVYLTCNQNRPVPVLHVHGELDGCARYDGGECGGCLQRFRNSLPGSTPVEVPTHSCEPVPEALASFRAPYACPATGTPDPDEPLCTRWSPCHGNAEVTLCTIPDMGHAWPSGSHGPVCNVAAVCTWWEDVVGPVSTAVDNGLLWRFFARHSL